ncbi:hypothetical protein OHB01_38995 [Microbispora hainanensis]|jgi:hypothetical protein|uniref:Uncharacterized protein n=1 Tax=Microbispora hainanensis TaxID=568844 RepID=A0ABZ1T3Z6_9ACTN|nr:MULTISPECIES: hypothetical protein [Microbispora]NJP23600.1 hypothetical protein [Microbispora sp. CL1-1]TQS15823.1 hypothetical protein FLW53_05160 [Microbispora sp. SCL1-1]
MKSLVVAPVLVGAYGVARIADGLDGSRGPGLAWTVGHLCFLAALVLFVQIFGRLRAMAGGGVVATAGYAAGLIGALALAAQFTIDLVVGFLSADHDAMGPRFEAVKAIPGVEPVVYTVVPLLFYVGMVVLVARLAAGRRVPWWSAVLVLVQAVLPLVSKDLIPLGAALLLLAFVPLLRLRPARPAVAARSPF